MSEDNKGNEMQGVVKWYNSKKGYGFVSPDDGSKDVFIHASAVRAASLRFLNEGQKITFTTEATDRGPSAINLKTID